jgi:hypothetical protein
MRSSVVSTSAPDRRSLGISARASWIRAAAVALALVVVFNGNFRAINSRDTAVNQYASLAMAATGGVDLDRYPALVKVGLARGYIQIINGQARSSYPLLPPLMAVPSYRAAIDLGWIDANAPNAAWLEGIGALTASVWVALACACVYFTILRWRPDAPAAAIALACGLATPLWSSASQALWSHAPAALLLGAGLLAVFGTPPRSSWRVPALVAAGALIVFAMSCRQLLVVFPIGLGVGLWRSREPRRHLAAFAIGAGVAGVVMLIANRLVFDTWLGGQAHLYTAGVNQDTHGVASAWSGHWLSGMAGVLVSPSRGLLIYMPIAGLAAIGAREAWRDGGLPRYGLVAATMAFLVLWGQYAVWWGGHSYGPRFAADIAIPLSLLASYPLARWRAIGVRARRAILAALVWSMAVQAVGALCYPAGEWNGLPRDVDLAHERLWDWRDSQLVRTLSAGTYGHYKASLSRTTEAPPATHP